jgi:hypothetical protein
MKHFGSTFILCFLGFLLTQARAIPSWKICSAHSDCQATSEYCAGNYYGEGCKCMVCSNAEVDNSSDGLVPTWCSDYLKFHPAASTTLTSSSVLTYVKQGGWENNVTLCPSFDACTKNCRKEYSVEKTTTQVTLTSTFSDTTDCVCDKPVFTIRTYSTDDTVWETASTNFGTVADTVQLWQYSTGALDITVWQDVFPATVDCVWEYSIGISSSPPPPSPPPPSPATTLTGLFGLISATAVAFVLV